FHTIPVPLDLVWPEALRIPLACQGPCRPRQEHPQASLEVHADAESEEVTVGQCVVIATEEIGVREASGIGVLVHRVHADAHGLGTLVEQTIGAIAIDVVGEGNVRRQVHACEDVAVISQGAQTVAPGVGGDEAIPAVTGRRLNIVRFNTHRRAIDSVSPITNIPFAFQSADVGIANLTHNRYTPGTQYLIEEMGEGRLDLGDFLAVVATIISSGLSQSSGDIISSK